MVILMSKINSIKIYSKDGNYYEYDVPSDLVLDGTENFTDTSIKLATHLILELQEQINNDAAIKKELKNDLGLHNTINN